jgi:hypothetical protein
MSVNICISQNAPNLGEGKISQRRNTFSTAAIVALSVLLLGSLALANSVPTINNPLVPGQKTPGSAAFTLTVNGTGFVSGSTVYWNGTARTTTFVKSSQLTASINASDVATAGTATVKVVNPTPGGGTSNVAYFQIIKGSYTVAYAQLAYTTDTTPQDAVAGDFNGDGKVDIAVATGNNTVSVLIGKGDGTFPTHVEYPVPGHPIAIAAADVNGDGKLDLITVDEFQSEISVLLGNGDGTFGGHTEFATGNHPVALAVGDVNGDGHLDVVVADLNDNKVAVLLGNGDGTFQKHKDYATGNGPSGVAIGDFNGDGKLDVAVANNTDATAGILLGNGDGTFQAPVPFPTSTLPNSVVVGDFNGDGVLDLAVGTSNKSVSVLLGVGDGTFQNHKEYTIGSNSQIVGTADVNADGKLDLISADFNDNTVSTLNGNGDGTFKGRSVFPTGSGPAGLAIGDFNGNGKLDIAVANSNVSSIAVLGDSVITLSPNVLGFGKNTSGFVTAPKTITFKNTGTTSISMPTTAFVGSVGQTDFSVQSTTCPAAGASLGAGVSCTINVVFDAAACEVADAQIQFTQSNGAVLGALLTGTGNIPITLTPRNQTFPTTLLGTTAAAKSNTFTNDSGVNIIFSLIDLEGVNQNDFAIASGTTCSVSQVLTPGASCTSNVTFTPTVSPAVNETVTMVYYGNFCLVKQGLLINGEGTAVKVSPTSYTFPNTKVGSTSTKTVTFQNAGSTAMNISSVNFINGTANVFSQTNNCQPSVAANSSCTFTVTFAPTTVGTQSATLSIGDPDITGPQQVKFTGTGD